MDDDAGNPLADLHRKADAEMASWGDVEIVATFGEPQAEYAAVRKAAGMIDWSQRGLLEITGKDRHAFLNNLLTNQTWSKADKKPLPAGKGVYAFLLNLKGRVVCDLNVLEFADRTLLDVDRRLLAGVAELLGKYHFTEQVTVTNRSEDLYTIALHGPGAAEVLGLSGLDHELATLATTIAGRQAYVWRDDLTGAPGYHLALSRTDVAAVWQTLLAQHGTSSDLGKRKLRPIGWAMFNALRIEAGRPLFGIDFDGQPVQTAFPGKAGRETETDSPGVLPAETGLLERAVSFTKGCYLGQEVVARMQARNQVARKIVGIRLETDALPFAGEPVYDADQNQVGAVTSSTNSPLLSGQAICLAFVKARFAATDTLVHVPAEGQLRQGRVVPLPFVATHPSLEAK
jgi:folate-binding protein YgfZ